MTGQKGSFGIPQDVLDAVAESKKKGRGEPTEKDQPKASAVYDSESIPEVEESPEKENADLDVKANDEVSVEEQIAEMKKSLGVEIDEDDLWSIFMGNQLVKKGIQIIPGKLEVTFTTLSMDITESIDKKMAEALEEKFLEAGIRNRQTKLLLAAGIVEMGKPEKTRSLGKDADERFEQLGKMSTVLVEKIAQKWNQFTWLVNTCVEQEMDSGKS